MGVYLKIGGVDVSGFITADSYKVQTAPVYDEKSAFVNIYGEKIRTRTGREVRLDVSLSDVDDDTAAALSEVLEGESVSVNYSAPGLKSGNFEAVKLRLALDRVFKGEKFWSAEISLFAAFVPEDGL